MCFWIKFQCRPFNGLKHTFLKLVMTQLMNGFHPKRGYSFTVQQWELWNCKVLRESMVFSRTFTLEEKVDLF